MQLQLLQTQGFSRSDILWFRARIRECIRYGEHGIDTEHSNGHTICMNCEGKI